MMRLPESPTQHIDRTQEISFSYGKKSLTGFKGDSVASALFANGVRIFSRSFKYHRPRGLYSLDGESSNCLMQVNDIPNVTAETTLLRNGMTIEPQNVWGSPNHDLMSMIETFDWAFPPGFYYRRFHKPYRLWPFFQERIRKVAGLGRLPENQDFGRFDHRFLNTEVCVVGGGPAGMTAALSAAESGLRVVLLEARPWLGGFYDWRLSPAKDNEPCCIRGQKLIERVSNQTNIEVITYCPLVGIHGGNLLSAFQMGRSEDPFFERLIEIRAGSVVMATGGLERPLLFENNERPGIMQAACANRLARTYGIQPGSKAVFSTGHDLMLETAVDLLDLGIEVTAVADSRPGGQDEALVGTLTRRNVEFLPGWVAVEATGKKAVSEVHLTDLNGSKSHSFTCDLLVASAGVMPNFAPPILAGAKPTFDKETGTFIPKNLPEKFHIAGRLMGYDHPEAIERSGHLAGLKASIDCGLGDEKALTEAREQLDHLSRSKTGSRLIRAPGAGKKTFVCFDEDVSVDDVARCADAGFDSIELLKRYSTAGMGPAQGGIPSANLPLVLAEYHGQEAGSIPPSNVRSPLVGTLMGTLAGRSYHLHKETPLHKTQEKLGGRFRLAGIWERVGQFSSEVAAQDEIENVHTNVGIIDVSTLGKFRIFGPDALKILQRIYVNDISTMQPGKLKYVAALNEGGALIDDGLIAQTGDNDYYFTTSTARADATIEWFRYHARHEDWDFHMVNLTDAYGAINLTGPNARKILERITQTDVSNEAFPYMGYRECMLSEDIPARILRIGFCGELGYELHCPASLTASVWDLVTASGKQFAIKPFGLEAMNALRLEKGHVIIGLDTEQIVNLLDLGLGFMWSRDKKGHQTIGVPALRQMENQPGRTKLIGFKMNPEQEKLNDGAIIVDTDIRGRVTGSHSSHILGETIGLALVEASLAEPGIQINFFQAGMDRNQRLTATVVAPHFYDPEGKRLKM